VAILVTIVKRTLLFFPLSPNGRAIFRLRAPKCEVKKRPRRTDDFILGMVEFMDGGSHQVHYLRRPFQREPDFGVTSVNYNFPELLARAEAPR
jgi:hypothetical protein